jgi:hypothetical protein
MAPVPSAVVSEPLEPIIIAMTENGRWMEGNNVVSWNCEAVVKGK